jgi:hypothetical protein
MSREKLGYVGGYKYFQNLKVLIMSMLQISINALWRFYSSFESMRGSQTLFSERKWLPEPVCKIGKTLMKA